MVEHLLCKQGVSGSNPLTSTNWVAAEGGTAAVVPVRNNIAPQLERGTIFDN